MGDVFARLQSFLASPFKGEDGDLLDWVMLVGITVSLMAAPLFCSFAVSSGKKHKSALISTPDQLG